MCCLVLLMPRRMNVVVFVAAFSGCLLGVFGGPAGCDNNCAINSTTKHIVCATNSVGEQMIFPNVCSLKYESCNSKINYVAVDEEHCKIKCGVCTSTLPLTPVCGQENNNTDFSRRDFASSCDLDLYNKCHNSKFIVISEGACDDAFDFQKPCSKQKDPVCGLNMAGYYNTFSNDCERKVFNTVSDPGYGYAYKGECQEEKLAFP